MSVNKKASFNKLNRSTSLPVVKFPLFRTLINKPYGDIELDFSEDIRKVIDIKSKKSETYKIDLVKNVVIFEDGKVFNLESLNTLNSRTGKSADKNEIIILANEYLNLNIASKNKKDVFIKAIKQKLNI